MTIYFHSSKFLAVPRTKHLTLKQAREERGWSQQQLADETKRVDPDREGVDQRTISKLERGAADDPMNSTVVLLEKAFGLQRGTLVFGREAIAS